MKILIAIAVFVVMVSAIFIFFTYDNLMSENIKCIEKETKKVCSFEGVGGSFIIGIMIIGFLLVVDFGVVYVIAKFLASPEATSAGYSYKQ